MGRGVSEKQGLVRDGEEKLALSTRKIARNVVRKFSIPTIAVDT